MVELEETESRARDDSDDEIIGKCQDCDNYEWKIGLDFFAPGGRDIECQNWNQVKVVGEDEDSVALYSI